MRQPLWIVNSSLFLLLLLILGFMFLFREELPERERIKPDGDVQLVKEQPKKINVSQIYEYDLFDTFQAAPALGPEPAPAPPPAPPEAAPAPVHVLEAPKPKFLDPLDVTLRGIMIVGEEAKNSAIIEDNQTKEEKRYHLGDDIEDAQLIRIFSNKVILIRSNGQQEVLYLRQKDAQKDSVFMAISDWEPVAERVAPNTYLVDPNEFVKRIHNVAQLIDILNLTTVYKGGVSIGCRIGKLEQNSLAFELGLQTGDMIIEIDGTPATNTENRFTIYKNVIKMKSGDAITAVIERNGKQIELLYELEELVPTEATVLRQAQDEQAKEQPEQMISERGLQKRIKGLRKRYEFAPTLKELKKRERESMINKGGRHKPRSPRTEQVDL